MIVNKNMNEVDRFLDLNNDITRILNIFNNCQELKKMLVHTDTRPLEREDIDKDLRDKQIARVPLLPYDEEEGSIVVITFINGEIDTRTNKVIGNIAIDIFTPGNQWIINEGIRPLQIAHIIDNLMTKDLVQTGGVKYRLSDIVASQLSDILLGYRLIYDVVIDD